MGTQRKPCVFIIEPAGNQIGKYSALNTKIIALLKIYNFKTKKLKGKIMLIIFVTTILIHYLTLGYVF